MSDINSAVDYSPSPQQVPVESHSSAAPTPAESSTPKEDKPVEKPSLETAIKTAFNRSQAKKAEADAKAPIETNKPEAKADVQVKAETPEAKAARERAPDGKFAPKEATTPSAPTAEPADGQDGKETPRPSEGRDYTKPPAHFLPRAKEAWPTVNPDVQGEVHRMRENYERGIAENKEAAEKWAPLKEFDQEAKAAGTTVPDYIRNVRAIEQLIQTNPSEGIKRVLATAGITPEQYAAHVMGQAQQPQNPQAQQTNQITQTMQQMAQELQQMRQREQQRDEEARLSAIEQKFITPFASEPEHSRYHELEEDIAFFLNSGKIPSTLSERERLEAAYDMAERINPAPKFSASPEPGTPALTPRQLNPAGLKSVTGSPTPGLSTTKAPGKEDAKDLDAILRRSLAKATAR